MSCGLPTPGPAEDFTIRAVTPQDHGVWYHVVCTWGHPDNNAFTFAEGWGNTRFAPIFQANGAPVHTYYLASTAEAAYMESVLHDAALSPPGLFELDSLRHYHLVTLALPTSLQCVSLHTHDLPRLQGLSRAQLIDSAPACYPETRAWAQAAYLQRPQAQALSYGSRRNDAGRCLMLFKQRLPEPPFEVLGVESMAIGPRRKEVLALVRSLKLHEV
jgi:RES domain